MKDYTIVTMAHVAVKDSDYNIYLSMCIESRHVHVFKYTDTVCAYEIFDNQEAACEFIERPLGGAPKRKR